MEIKLFHGTISNFKEPNLDLCKKISDYGQAFYCTPEKELAKEWASKQNLKGFIHEYSLELEGLSVLDLTKDNYSILNWVSILLENRLSPTEIENIYKEEMEYLSRYYIDTTKFDVVIGFRADDAYFAFPKEFLNNRLTLESLSKIYSLGNLGKQFAIVSKKALKQLKYVSTEELEMNYHKQYISRLNEAKKSFNDILLDDNKRYGKTLWELIKQDAVIN